MSAQHVEFDPEAGDVPARASAVCQHGNDGFCWDDATPEERAAVDYLFKSAFNYAIAVGARADVAEAYAVWFAAEAWHPGVVVMECSHPHEWARFKQAALAVQEKAA